MILWFHIRNINRAVISNTVDGTITMHIHGTAPAEAR